MTAGRLLLVARHAFREHLRDRLIYGPLAFALIVAATALVADPLSAGEGVKVVKDLGLALIELSGALMAVVMGAGLITREIDRRTILSLLAKPLPRWELLVGAYAGLVLTLVTAVALMGTMLLVIVWFMGALDSQLVVAMALIGGELALLAAVATLFSSFTSSLLISVILTVGVFIAGELSADLRSFGNVADVPVWTSTVLAVVGWALPDFSSFDVKAAVVHGQSIGYQVVALTFAYGALYAGALIAVAVVLFSRREFR